MPDGMYVDPDNMCLVWKDIDTSPAEQWGHDSAEQPLLCARRAVASVGAAVGLLFDDGVWWA